MIDKENDLKLFKASLMFVSGYLNILNLLRKDYPNRITAEEISTVKELIKQLENRIIEG